MAEPSDSLVEERKAYMVSSTEEYSKPVYRTAHFLKPSLPTGNPPPFHSSSHPISTDPLKWQSNLRFENWWYSPHGWNDWVVKMESEHGAAWKKAGIFEAVKASATSRIVKDSNLMIGLAQKWCPETNTFLFPWGEATVTLEDVMVIGGYSALGALVSSPPESKDMVQAEKELRKARDAISKENYGSPLNCRWLSLFKGSGSSIEHEAFLALWLSRFVFLNNKKLIINKSVFKVAVNLARGNRIALAPAVLASIYRDLTVLKNAIFSLVHGVGFEKNKYQVDVLAPFALVQVWIWERFQLFRPTKGAVARFGHPRITRWNGQKTREIKTNTRSGFESYAEGGFQWRPYTENTIFEENDKWVLISDDKNEELMSFAKCLVPCELVGLDGCIEQYLPHRVARQFGMDQDLPAPIIRSNLSLEAALTTYDDSIVLNKKLYVPPRMSNPGFTARYLQWWESVRKLGVKVIGLPQGVPESLRDLLMHLGSTEKMNNVSFPSVPPGFEHKESSVGSDSGNDEEDHMTLEELFSPNSKRKRCSTETARTSCAGSSNAGELNTRTGNELKTAVTALEQEEKQAEQEQEQSSVEYTNQNEDQTAMEEEVEVVECTNPNEAASQFQKSEEEVGDYASKLIELSMAERSNFSARMKQIDSIRARVSNAERNFAEIKAEWERENEVYIQSQ